MASSSTRNQNLPTDQPASDQPAILSLPLELREEIYYFALQDTLFQGPIAPYDEHLPKGLPSLQRRFRDVTSLRQVSRQFQIEVDQVFQREILPHTPIDLYFHLLPGHELPQLCDLRRKVLALPHVLRGARFYLRSPDKETICANDDADMIWDTLVQSQEGCGRLPYEEDGGVIAEWTVNASSAPEDVTISSHSIEKCGCEAGHRYSKACAFATVHYQPLAKSLRLTSFVWPNHRFQGDETDEFVVCSTLEGKFEDLDLNGFDVLARRTYHALANDLRPPAFWEIYGEADVDRKVALRDELIDVGADYVVESQKERCGIVNSP